MNRGTGAVWPIKGGFALLCDCGITTRTQVIFRGPHGELLPPPHGRVVHREVAITCEGCGSAHWLTVSPEGTVAP